MPDNDIHILIKKIDGDIKAHAILVGPIDNERVENTFAKTEAESSETDDSATNTPTVQEKGELGSPFPEDFRGVERSFTQAMLMYRKSVVETINFAPVFAAGMLGVSVERVANSHGIKRDDLSTDEIFVHSAPDHAFGLINRFIDQSNALIEGAQHLPKIATIGLISSYDAILSDLLQVIFKQKPEIVFTSDRVVKFSELLELDTLEAVRDSIIGNEIEGVIRQSHHEQFEWMEKKFGMKLREGLDIWPDFIELCERRNLLTHTDGVVSEQYLKNCESHGKKAKSNVGDKLVADLAYLTFAINTVSEIGFKLIHTMWRKFLPDEREQADIVLNETGMDLIAAGEYDLAEVLLQFGVTQKRHSSDLLKRMMIVNLANAAKLGGNKDRCDRALSSHDWSATSYQFQICVAAVKNDFKEVIRLLKLGGSVIEITPSGFRDWPVFRDARKDKAVQVVFAEVFGEPLEKDGARASSATSKLSETIECSENGKDTIVH